MNYFENSLQHLLSELERIDLLIAAQVARMRRLNKQDEQFRGLYISEEDVNALLNQPIGCPKWAIPQAGFSEVLTHLERMRQQIRLRREESLSRGIDLRLDRIQNLYELDQFEVDILLTCMAVELDLRYERLYAYLQDDVTKKRPSVELVCNLLTQSPANRFGTPRYFGMNASLFRNDLLELIEDPSQLHPPLLAKYLKVNNRIVQFLLGSDKLDEKIQPFATISDMDLNFHSLLVNDEVKQRLNHFLRNSPNTAGVIVYLFGPDGVGRQSTAEAFCREQAIPLLVVDCHESMSQSSDSRAKLFNLIHREATLQEAAVYWRGFDTLLVDQNQIVLRRFQHSLENRPVVSFLAGENLRNPVEQLRGVPYARIELQKPNFSQRLRIWSAALNANGSVDSNETISALATKFKFTGGQILDASATAENLARLRNSETLMPDTEDLYEACRLHSNQKLASLARKIIPKYQWNDIVLPPDRLEQLREICNHIKYRERVYGEWGFDQKLSLGKGLSVLFAGPSGTGKTMAAEIIAGELGLELYKIDLSMVVSKYIGETEKNLAKIFSEAETSNAILFFDEADALFGKRSEVRDSHDRYANIEIGFLLQRMEEYQGVVILATNFRRNMDEAFVRRLHFTIELPFPNILDRSRIWRGIWPEDTPKDSTLDFGFLARRFEISGGNIRNIALSAAFFAADNGGVVNMGHLLRATQREYQKMGKVIAEGEFGESERTASP